MTGLEDEAGSTSPWSRTGRRTRRGAGKPSEAVQRTIWELFGPNASLHPALIPGISIPDTGKRFRLDAWVFGITALFVAVFVTIGLASPDLLGSAAEAAVHWVSTSTGWLFSSLTVVVFIFMLVVGYSQKGHIRLGADDEKPEFSGFSWVAMLFAAGMGIGLLFYGPYEPLFYYLNVPPSFQADPETVDAMYASISQTILHWGPLAWSYYALVGGAIAYSAYRRGRPPVISALFDPIFSEKTKGPLGAVIDISAILVTLFGTAVSLGLGALQIGRGIEIVAGLGPLGNAMIVTIMVVLAIGFIFSAVSGVKRGIRILSNINMVLVGILGLFIFIAGPTIFILNFIPSSAVAFVSNLGTMMNLSGAQGPEAEAFMETWTTYYWAWWVSWTPFVGMFLAKISRGRTLREFVTVVIIVPSTVCIIWFSLMGGTAMWMEYNGYSIASEAGAQDIFFAVISNLPGSGIINVLAIFALGIFFVTSADSASIVMSSISQKGKPNPMRRVTVVWGVALAAIAITLLLAGGADALSALQALVTVSALPFAIVLIFLMVAWWKDLSTDPLVLRNKYAVVAIDQGVRLGIQAHGDNFAFSAAQVSPRMGAGAWLDSTNPALTEWYEDALAERLEAELEARAVDASGEETGPDPSAPGDG